jgi:hypothetical protein
LNVPTWMQGFPWQKFWASAVFVKIVEQRTRISRGIRVLIRI